ncbi:MAG TPA: hypothetical protein DD706_08980 [Nitrospiraceae bacterium]|nr:hypothetical protein [Nitrospiraceae bacterium]
MSAVQETYSRYEKLLRGNSKNQNGNIFQLFQILMEAARGFHFGGHSVHAQRMMDSAWRFLQTQHSLDDNNHDRLILAYRDFLGIAIKLREGELSQKAFDRVVHLIHSQKKETWSKLSDHGNLLLNKFKIELEINKKDSARMTAHLAAVLYGMEPSETPSTWLSTLAYMYAALGDLSNAMKYLEAAQTRREWWLKNEEESSSTYRQAEYRFFNARDKAVVAHHIWKLGFVKEGEKLFTQAIKAMESTPYEYDDIHVYQRQIILAAAEMEMPDVIEVQILAGFDDTDWYPAIFRTLLRANRLNAITKLTTTDEAKAVAAEVQTEFGDYENAVKTAQTIHSRKFLSHSSIRAIAFAWASIKGATAAKAWAKQGETNYSKTSGLLGVMDFLIGSQAPTCRITLGWWQGHSTLNC